MTGNLEAVFSQVVMACSVAALAAIAMREATSDRTLHLCARVLGLSAWTALLALSYFTVREYEKLERILIVRQSSKVAEPALISKTEMELPSGITIAWTHTSAPPRGWCEPMSDLCRPDGRHRSTVGEPAADSQRDRWSVQGVPGSPVSIPAVDGAAQTF